MSAWFRAHPRALTPAFAAFLRSLLDTRGAGEEEDTESYPARFTLRVIHVCREAGDKRGLARLAKASAGTAEFEALISRIQERLQSPDSLHEAAPLCERLLDHPFRMVVEPRGHTILLTEMSMALRKVQLFASRSVPGLPDLRIRVALAALDPPPQDRSQHAELLVLLGHAHSDRSEHTGDADDLRRALKVYEEARGITSEHDPERADRIHNVGAAYRDLHVVAEERDALDRAIELFEQAVALRGNHTLYVNNLAVSLRDRFLRDGEPADLERSIAAFEHLAATASEADVDLPRVLTDYSSVLRQRFDLTSTHADIDRAVELGERAIALEPRGPVLVQCLTELGEALAVRATVRGDEAEFRRSVSLLEQARAVAEPGSRLLKVVVGKQAIVHGLWALQGPGDVRDVVPVLRTALTETAEGTAEHWQLTQMLLASESMYARHSRDPEEMTRAIARLEAYAPDGNEDSLSQVDVTGLLAELYVSRGMVNSSLADLDNGILLGREAAAETALACGLAERFALTLQADDLEGALATIAYSSALSEASWYHWQQVAQRITEVAGLHPALADGREIVTVALGLASRLMGSPGPAAPAYAILTSQLLVHRYGTSGDQEDLRRATEILEARLATTPPDARIYDHLLVLTGARWREQYSLSADTAAFRRATERLEHALSRCGPGSPHYPNIIGTLGTVLRAHYNFTGDLGYLDKAIAAYEQAISGWDSEDHTPSWAVGVSNLANALRASYDATGEGDRLSRAISLHEQAVAALPPGHPDLPQRLMNLASAHMTRFFGLDEQRADLDRAQALLRRVLDDIPANSPVRPDTLAALSISAAAKFQVTNELADLDEAVELARKALRSSRTGTLPEKRTALQLAEALSRRHTHQADAAAGAEATAIFRRLCTTTEVTDPRVSRVASVEWAHWAAGRGAWEEAAEASRAATEVLNELVRLQVSRGLRNRVIRQNRDFGAFAAYALTRAGDYEAAVMAVETARAVSLSEALQLGSADVRWLSEHGQHDLAERFKAAAARWLAAAGDGLERDLLGGTRVADFPDHDAAVRAARTDLENLVDEIRTTTGRAEFLKPPTFADVAAGAPDRLVYLVTTEYGGAALIVDEGDVRPLDLPTLTREQVTRWLRALIQDGTLNWWARLENVARELWDAVLGPLTETLGQGPVTLIRSGYLELLPMNAAWTAAPDRPGGRRYVMDELPIRTVPNALVLATAVARARRAGQTSVLAVQDPQPVSAAPLKQAAVEIAGVRSYFSDSVVLAGEQAVPEAVLPLLKDHDVVHFACHGSADLLNPLSSSLTLAGDAPLELRDILRVRLGEENPVRLVVLSACETGVIGLDVPNEVVSLASSLLEAGVAGVIASQWQVPDLSTALLMLRFYAEWKTNSQAPASALHAAQRWLRDTTNKEKADYFAPGAPNGLPHATARGLRRTLIRLEPGRKGFAHPVHWAGFVFVGA
ncbi:CHAT domain-containing protein [Streptomyces sp. NRRL S-37]|uniref:CHAT domain-containing protein n=1 Tax=Streptomyces sp. NRRL S-37 TaxID=1463903 RepID=UPI00131B6D2C|nr:CHAT domain-containing protein [Streptomyces sp. NRRL S-37]